MKKITPILNRLRKFLNVRTDKELTKILNISYSTLDTWKNRDKIPEKRLTEIAHKYNLSLDWLLTGKDNWGMPLNTSNVIENLKSFFNLKTDEELIKYLNDNLSYKIDSNTLNEWKKTNKVPHGLLSYIAKENNVSIDELLNNKIIQSFDNDSELETICNYIKELDNLSRKKVLKYILDLQID